MSGQARSSVVVIRDSTLHDHRESCLPPGQTTATTPRSCPSSRSPINPDTPPERRRPVMGVFISELFIAVDTHEAGLIGVLNSRASPGANSTIEQPPVRAWRAWKESDGLTDPGRLRVQAAAQPPAHRHGRRTRPGDHRRRHQPGLRAPVRRRGPLLAGSAGELGRPTGADRDSQGVGPCNGVGPMAEGASPERGR
jgi:hypothetical protein